MESWYNFLKEKINSDFDFLDLNIPDAQSSQMKFSLAVNYRKIIIDGNIDENVALECIYYLNKIKDLDLRYEDKKPIEIYINSNGGSAFECFLIVDLIEQMKSDGYEIVTINMGKAYSAGMAIALCGSVRKSFKRARYMIHDVLSSSFGKSQELMEHLEESTIIKDIYYDIIRKYSNITLEEMKSWQERKLDKFFSADEMFELKGVDQIL